MSLPLPFYAVREFAVRIAAASLKTVVRNLNTYGSKALGSVLAGAKTRKGLIVAGALALLFLVLTAYTSAATLFGRVESTDVTQAAAGGAWSGKIAWQIAYFVSAQLVLHAAFGLLAWVLAVATVVARPMLKPQFIAIVIGWFCLLAAATLAYNALWFPRTLIGAHYHDAAVQLLGPLRLGQWIYHGIMGFALLICVAATSNVLKTIDPSAKRSIVVIGCAIGLLVLITPLLGKARNDATTLATPTKPNVIFIGIDSLRLSELNRFGGTEGNTPNLDRYLVDADVITDATTPAARTFSSWIAILTGRSPPTTGARFNLAARDTVHANPTLADLLRQHAYRTVYSTDEVRFANIDESYGFDEVITPPIGASDFLIGTYNELPLPSVVINSRLGKLLFPFSYGNRGVATMFQPDTYLGRLERDLNFDRPTFLVTHLTASHWPYYISATPFGVSKKSNPGDRPMYRIGLRTVDDMFGDVMTMLQNKGALDNAIVVVLSDHGEALGLANDSFFETGSIVEGLGAPLKMLDIGHGQSVLSPSQYHVLLSFKAFGPKRQFVPAGRELSALASVEDITPTIADLLGLSSASLRPDGVSLVSQLRGSTIGGPDAMPERIRFTETDLAVLPAPDGGVDEVGTAKENSKFFAIDPDSGRLAIKHDFAPLALAFKERAAFTSKNLLAAMPAGPDAHQFLFFDLETGSGRLLMSRPGGDSPEADRLWAALHNHYSGELRKPTRVTPADWPAIEAGWKNFLVNRRAADAPADNKPGT